LHPNIIPTTDSNPTWVKPFPTERSAVFPCAAAARPEPRPPDFINASKLGRQDPKLGRLILKLGRQTRSPQVWKFPRFLPNLGASPQTWAPEGLLKNGDWLRATDLSPPNLKCREAPVPLFQRPGCSAIARRFCPDSLTCPN